MSHLQRSYYSSEDRVEWLAGNLASNMDGVSEAKPVAHRWERKRARPVSGQEDRG